MKIKTLSQCIALIICAAINLKGNPMDIMTIDEIRQALDVEKADMAFSQVAPYTESIWSKNYNTDESKVHPYTLPEIKSKTVEEWEKTERPQLLQQFKDIMYGQMPPAPDELSIEVLSQKDDALNGLAIRKEIKINCDMANGRHFDFEMLLYVPKKANTPPPVFVGLNFSGNQYNTTETDVRLSKAVFFDFDKNLNRIVFRMSETDRGKKLEAWSYEEAMKRGYAVATACYADICPDYWSGLKASVFTLFCEPKALRCDYEVPFSELQGNKWTRKYSIIGAWAWGLSRMLDALEQEKLVDATKAITVGHSRLGKTALWAGVCDQRFAGAISNNSGSAGAKLSRRNFGENLAIDYWEKGTWLCGKIVQYLDCPENLPFDQHQLIALMAPRGAYVASATKDLNSDPKGEFLAAKAASPAWNLYGIEGLESKEMPAADNAVGGRLSYHLREGKHAITAWDWNNYYDFADRLFAKDSN